MDRIAISTSLLNDAWFKQKPERLFWLLDLVSLSKDGILSISLGELGKRWIVSRSAVRRYLDMLKKANLIVQNTILAQEGHNEGTTLTQITLCNYGSYIVEGHNLGTALAQPQTEEEDAKEVKKDLKEVVKKPRRDRPNDVQEVRDYVQEKGYHFNADEFYAFYESSNWYRGKTKITNWKQCCVTWETKWKNGRKDYEEANKKVLEDNQPMGKGSYGAVIHYIADHSENIIKCVPLPTETEVAEISQNYKDFFVQAVKNMDSDPNLSKKTFWGAFVNAIQLTKRTIDYGTTQHKESRYELQKRERDERMSDAYSIMQRLAEEDGGGSLPPLWETR